MVIFHSQKIIYFNSDSIFNFIYFHLTAHAGESENDYHY